MRDGFSFRGDVCTVSAGRSPNLRTDRHFVAGSIRRIYTGIKGEARFAPVLSRINLRIPMHHEYLPDAGNVPPQPQLGHMPPCFDARLILTGLASEASAQALPAPAAAQLAPGVLTTIPPDFEPRRHGQHARPGRDSREPSTCSGNRTVPGGQRHAVSACRPT